MNPIIYAIENVLHKRMLKGASDESLILWCEHLKTVHKNKDMQTTLDGFIDAIKQTPLKG